MKIVFKEKRFRDVEEKNLTTELKALSSDSFADCFQKVLGRYIKFIAVNGDYFNKY